MLYCNSFGNIFGTCKPVAYHSSHNVYIYNLGSQQITVDYSTFGIMVKLTDSLTQVWPSYNSCWYGHFQSWSIASENREVFTSYHHDLKSFSCLSFLASSKELRVASWISLCFSFQFSSCNISLFSHKFEVLLGPSTHTHTITCEDRYISSISLQYPFWKHHEFFHTHAKPYI